MSDLEIVHLDTNLGVDFKMAINRHDTDAVTQSVRSRNYSLSTAFETLLAGVPRQATILDLGAHIGTFSIAAAAFGYDVIAVEASPRNVELLSTSVQLNGFNNLHVVPAAIADRVGTTFFFENGPYGIVNTSRFAPSGSFQIATTTVDELVSQLPIEAQISFIKMDIEGSEFAALQGMPKLLAGAEAPPIFYESNGHTLYLFDKTPAMLVAELRRYGYQSYLAESKRLVPLGEDYFQYSCVVDNLAAKKLVGQWNDWRTAETTIEEQIERAVAESGTPSAAQRAYVARALEHAQPSVLRDARIQSTLKRLRMDNDPEVIKAMGWFVAN